MVLPIALATFFFQYALGFKQAEHDMTICYYFWTFAY